MIETRENSQEMPVRKDVRLKHYDYSAPAGYFLTICTKNRRETLSSIQEGEAVLTELGYRIDQMIRRLPERYPDITVRKYVVMPNHVHMLLERIAWRYVSEQGSPVSLGNIVRGWKSSVTKRVGEPIWQRGYYEHIIRDDNDMRSIWQYIENNPKRWEMDKYHPAKDGR